LLTIAISAAFPVPAEEVAVVTPSGGRHVMVQVPAGPFKLSEHEPQVILSSSYYIDKFEVSNALYAGFVAATGRPSAGSASDSAYIDLGFPVRAVNGPDYPVSGVTWDEANDYCAWAGLRLPSEAEWEKAARGTDGRAWPWGNAPPTPALANLGKEVCPADKACYGDGDASDGYFYTAPVDSYPQGASPYGAYNMEGNVREWMSDWFGPSLRGGQVDPRGPDTPTNTDLAKVARGQDYAQPAESGSFIGRYSPNSWTRQNWLGFRCAQSASAMPTTEVKAIGWGQVKQY
jgi:formylglycine-generating enzyme required for sulfatase activity